MANFAIPDIPEFSTEMEMLEARDPAHAELFNDVFSQLLENDAYIADYTKVPTLVSSDGIEYMLKKDAEGVYLEKYKYSVFSDRSVSLTGGQSVIPGFLNHGFVEGHDYIVTWNGVKYKATCIKEPKDNGLAVGNLKLSGLSDEETEYPFLIYSYGATSCFVYKETDSKETITLGVVGINTDLDVPSDSSAEDSLRLISKSQLSSLINSVSALQTENEELTLVIADMIGGGEYAE